MSGSDWIKKWADTMPAGDVVGFAAVTRAGEPRAAPSSAVGGDDAGGALVALTLAARALGVPADLEQVRLAAGGEAADLPMLADLAARLGLSGRIVTLEPAQAARLPTPALLPCADGVTRLLVRTGSAGGDEGAARLLLHDPASGRPAVVDAAALADLGVGAALLLKVAHSEASGAAPAGFGWRWFIHHAGKYRRLLAEVALASVILQIFALVSPLLFQVVIDKVLVHKSLSTLDILALALVAMAAFEAALGAVRGYVLSHATARLDVELGAGLVRQMLRLPLAWFQARRIGDVVVRLKELDTVRAFLTGASLTLAIDLLFTVLFLVVMAGLSWELTAAVLISLPFYAAVSLVITPLLKKRLEQKYESTAEVQAQMTELVGGIETVKSMAAEPRAQRRWEERLAEMSRENFLAGQIFGAGGQAVGLLSKLVTAFLLWYGARLVMEGSLSVGALVAFNMLAARVAAPILRLAQIWQEIQQVQVAIDRLADIMDSPPEPSLPSARTDAVPLAGRIRFEHVGFRYRPDAPEVLSDIGFEIAPGGRLGIVGRSGSGKSTLVRLIQRLSVPERGRILIDGQDIAQLDPGWLRRQIAVVQQDGVLFNRSVRENIAYADPAAAMERVQQAAELAGAHAFILSLSQGYDTGIGERGTLLSGGQRQRLMIARALLTDPRILILDEATSALDSESELAIQRNMERICAGRTVIIISHRLSALRGCGGVLVLDRGRLVEAGRHEDLLARNGTYARLWAAQMGLYGAPAPTAGAAE